MYNCYKLTTLGSKVFNPFLNYILMVQTRGNLLTQPVYLETVSK